MSLTVSAAGLALIKTYEGFRAEPALLPNGDFVVGYGHVRCAEPGPAVSEAEAEALLRADLKPIEAALEALGCPLLQAQIDALASFAFSIGVEAFQKSDVARRVAVGAFLAAGCAMEAWRKSDVAGELEVLDVLIQRRAAEKALLLADLAVVATPSAFARAKLDHAAAILGAPVSYAPAPAVGSILPPAPKPAPAQVITDILKSEPATELVLSRVATPEEVAAFEEAEEIVTAHAKPVGRPMFAAKAQMPRFAVVRVNFGTPVETIGLSALFLFGVGLSAIGATMVMGRQIDAIDMIGASAFAAPGLAAIALAAYGLWKTPARQMA